MHPPLEVPVFSAAGARTAVARGARRLEVNRAGSYAAGGLTPSPAEVAAVAAAAQAAAAAATTPASPAIPLRIMIRPRGPPAGPGPDFVYGADEVAAMRDAIAAFAASGLLQPARGDGFVFGVLREEETEEEKEEGRPPPCLAIDVDRNRQLVAAAAPFACVFHRAMDLVLAPRPRGPAAGRDEEEAATDAIAALRACGFAGVLTAGGPDARGAAGHASMLRRLVTAAAAAAEEEEQRLEVIVGGGVRSAHAAALARAVCGPHDGDGPAAGSVVFHASCLRAGEEASAAAETVDGDEVERLCAVLAAEVE